MKTTSLIFKVAIAWSCAVFSFSAVGQDSATNEPDVAEKRVEFFQQNFSKFVPVHFQKDTNADAVMQFLPVSTNLFEYGGAYYCGFRCTVPQWLDGDFEWLYLLAKTGTNQDF